jgi:hypothetical protein
MFRGLHKVFRDVNTENDGKSWDAVRVAGSTLLIPGIPIFFWGVIYNTLHTGHFDFGGFAWGMGGIASVILSLASGVALKARSDVIVPPQYPQPPTGESP